MCVQVVSGIRIASTAKINVFWNFFSTPPGLKKFQKNVDFRLWGSKPSAFSCQNGFFPRVLAHCAFSRTHCQMLFCSLHDAFSIVREKKKTFAQDLDLLWINTSTNFKCHHAKCQYTNNVHNAGKQLQGDAVVLIIFKSSDMYVRCPKNRVFGYTEPTRKMGWTQIVHEFLPYLMWIFNGENFEKSSINLWIVQNPKPRISGLLEPSLA